MIRRRFWPQLIVLIIITFSVSYGHESCGLATGNLTTANACGFGVGYMGGFFGLGDDATSLFGSVTYGFSDYTDGRLKLGFSDPDGGIGPSLLIATDFKYQFMDYNNKSRKEPLDMAFGGLLEYVKYDEFSILELGGNLIGSIPYRLSGGQRLIPYGRFDFRLEKYSNGGSESSFQVGLNLGTKYELSHDMNIYGEFQIDGNFGLFAGLEFQAF